MTALDEDADEVFSQVTTGHVETENSVWEGITFVDGDSVGDTITRVEDDTGGTTGSVEGKDGLDGDVESGGVEGFKHDLGHLLAVRLGVQGSFGQENGVFLGGNTEFIVEGVVPDLLHIVPVGHDTVFNGVTESKDTSLGLSLVTHVGVLLTHTDHDAGVARTADNGWEDLTHAKCQNSCFFVSFPWKIEVRQPGARESLDRTTSRRTNYSVGVLTARGASSPAKPALHIPEPLSITNYAEMVVEMSTGK